VIPSNYSLLRFQLGQRHIRCAYATPYTSARYLQIVHSPGQNCGIFNLRRCDIIVKDHPGSDNWALWPGLLSVI